jgi:hypothetical protein
MWYHLAVCTFLFAFVSGNIMPANAQQNPRLLRPPLLLPVPQQVQPPAILSNCQDNCAFQANGCTNLCPTGAAQTLCVQNCSLQQTSCQQVCNGLNR